MWFVENPWPPLFIGTFIGIVLLVSWASSGEKKKLVYGLLALVIAGSAFAIDALVVTDPERVESLVRELVQDVEQGNVDATLGYFSADANEMKSKIELAMNLVDVNNVRVTDTSVKINDKGQAVVHFRANGSATLKRTSMGGHRPTRWEITWEKEGADWKIVTVQRLNVMTGEALELMNKG